MPSLPIVSFVFAALLFGEPLAVPAEAARPPQDPNDEPDLGIVDWFQGAYFSAVRKAQADKTQLVVVVWVEDGSWCDRLFSDTFSNPQVAEAVGDLVCFQADLTRDANQRFRNPRVESVARRFPVRIFPSIFFVGPEGRLEDVIMGYIPPTPFLGELARVASGTGTRTALEAAVSAAPKDIAARLALSRKLQDLGDVAAAEAELSAIRKLDPDETSVEMRNEVLRRAIEAMEGLFNDAEGHYPTEDLEQLLAKERQEEVLFSGWSYLASLRERLGRWDEAKSAYQAAWSNVAPSDTLTFGNTLATAFWKHREKLDQSDRKLALRVAQEMAKELDDLEELDSPSKAGYLDTLACCYYMNDKRADAIETIRTCMRLDPKNPAFPLRLKVFEVRR